MSEVYSEPAIMFYVVREKLCRAIAMPRNGWNFNGRVPEASEGTLHM